MPAAAPTRSEVRALSPAMRTPMAPTGTATPYPATTPDRNAALMTAADGPPFARRSSAVGRPDGPRRQRRRDASSDSSRDHHRRARSPYATDFRPAARL